MFSHLSIRQPLCHTTYNLDFAFRQTITLLPQFDVAAAAFPMGGFAALSERNVRAVMSD